MHVSPTCTEYCVATPSDPLPGAPAVMLVHGFGAFGDQWRGNMGALAAAGYTVFAPTLPGYGRSEKSAVVYSQDMWQDFLRDFVLQVRAGLVGVWGAGALSARRFLGLREGPSRSRTPS
jgi:pimeloyl-ACP methyl ester carboxylesterase